MFASMFLVGGVNALRNSDALAARTKPFLDRFTTAAHRVAPSVPVPDSPVVLVRVNAAAQVLAALSMATGRAPRISGFVLAASLVPTTWAGHPFWTETDPAMRANQKTHFFKNLSMLGGALLAAVDTEGQPGVAWRARRAGRDVRREARHQVKQATLGARLAAKRVS